MSIRFKGLAWVAPLRHSRKLVLLCLADMANDQGECHPTAAAVASRCSLSRDTVAAAFDDLEAGGFLSRSRGGGGGAAFKIREASPR